MKKFKPLLKKGNLLTTLCLSFMQKILLIFIICLFISVTYILAQDSQEWTYPVHSGTSEGLKTRTFKEMLYAVNVPESQLTNMTTKDLVQTCLNYPYWILITSRTSHQGGYNYLRSNFNGFQELENRPDAGINLINIYREMNPEDVNKFETLLSQGKFILQFSFLEILMSQRAILSNLSTNDLNNLIKASLSAYKSKIQLREKYSIYSLSTTYLLLGRLLEQSNNLPDESTTSVEIKSFVDKGELPSSEVIIKILTTSEDYVSKLEI